MSDLSELPQAEAVVIAKAIATGGDFLDEIEVVGDDFSSNEGRWAFDAIRRMMAAGTPIDTLGVGITEPRVERWLWGTSGLSLHAAMFHADLVHEAGVRRRIFAIGGKITATAKIAPLSELIEGARKDIDDAAGLRRQPISFVGEMIGPVVAEAQEPRTVYGTPWEYLTTMLGGGFRPGALYVVAARPAMGKTAIALQMGTSMAKHGLVAFSSLEMPREELVRRLISQGTYIGGQTLERGEPLGPHHLAKIDSWHAGRAPITMSIDDRSTITVSDVRAYARSVKRTGHLTGVMVDYLQLMAGPSGMKRYEIITEITRQLKIMARELECPVVALSQLNRNSEGRMDRRPQLSDLRESGSIEQDADVVILLHRDPAEEPGADGRLPLELIVAKNRHGPSGSVNLLWDGPFMRAD